MDLEDKLMASFKRRYQEFISKHGDNPIKLQKEFNSDGGWFVGAANISRELEEIISFHGQPKSTSIPKRVKFAVVRPEHKWAEGAGAFFTVVDDSYVIGVVTEDILKVPFDTSLPNTIAHELQHVLKMIYEGSMNISYTSTDDWESYYSDKWEVQAYTRVLAKSSFDAIRGLYESRIESTMQENPQKAQNITNSLKRNKDMLAKSFLIPEVQRFLDRMVEKEAGEVPSELRTQYFKYAYKDFVILLEEFHAKLSDMIMLYAGQTREPAYGEPEAMPA
jgi:hypothetical protein